MPVKKANCGFEISIETITPIIAKEYLTLNPHNRKIMMSKVKVLARDMRNGAFKLTHQGIAFDENGNLLDGQHRLSAIVMSDMTLQMVVARGLPRETIRTMDGGTKRSVSNHEDVTKEPCEFKYTDKYGTVAKIVEFGAGGQIAISMSETFELIEKYKKGLMFVMQWGSVTYAHASILAVLLQAYYNNPDDADRISKFMEIFKSGESESKEDLPPVKLRNYMINRGKSETGFHGRDRIYGRTQTALYAFLHHKQIKCLSEYKGNRFPIPQSVIDGKWSVQTHIKQPLAAVS